MGAMRIPVTYPMESRDGTLAKDAKLKNMVTEMIEGKPWAVKRPGIRFTTQVVSGGVSQGVIDLSGVLYGVYNDQLYTPRMPIKYSSGASYVLGDAVISNGCVYYALAGDSTSPPGESPEEIYPEPVQGAPGVPFGTKIYQIGGGKSIHWSDKPPSTTEYGLFVVPSGVTHWGFGSPRAALQYAFTLAGGGGGYTYYCTADLQVAYSQDGGTWVITPFGTQQYVVTRPYTANAGRPL